MALRNIWDKHNTWKEIRRNTLRVSSVFSPFWVGLWFKALIKFWKSVNDGGRLVLSGTLHASGESSVLGAGRKQAEKLRVGVRG